MKILVLGSCCSIHFPRPGCKCSSCTDPIFQKRKHSSILIKDIMVDCGKDWIKVPSVVKKIILTHSHPDHSWGVKWNLDKELFMSRITKNILGKNIPSDKEVNILDFGKSIVISGIKVTSYPVLHSTIAPANCIKFDNLLYCPDVREILNKSKVLGGVSIYIGDGSSFARPITYKVGIGHESMVGQLDWCKRAGVKKVYFTHIGHVRLSHLELNRKLKELNKKFNFKEVKVLKEGDVITK